VNTDKFIQFLHALRNQIPHSDPVYVYLDNLRVHHTFAVKDYCSQNNIFLVFAPTYSSMYNPIERIWALSKQQFRRQFALEQQVTQSRVKELIISSVLSVSKERLAEHVVKCLCRMIDYCEQGHLL
jgi:transposase